jgi:acetoin utilization protein AcuB
MRIFEVMTDGVQAVAADASAEDAWTLMRREGIHHLVVKAGAQVVGVLSDRDAGGASGSSVRKGRIVAELMTAPVVTIDAEEPVRKAANLMRGRTIGCLPVMRKGRLVGIVTVSDLLRVLGTGTDRPSATERHALSSRVPHAKVKGTGRRKGAW